MEQKQSEAMGPEQSAERTADTQAESPVMELNDAETYGKYREIWEKRLGDAVTDYKMPVKPDWMIEKERMLDEIFERNEAAQKEAQQAESAEQAKD